MKNSRLSFLFAIAMLFTGLQTFSQANSAVIGKPDLKLSSDIMTPEVLWSFGRVSDIQLSPDKKNLLFGISYYSIEANKGNRDLYSIELESKDMTRLTETSYGEYNAVWRPDGKK